MAECKASKASCPIFWSHWRLIGDTVNCSHFSLMRLKALLVAVVVSAAGLVIASPAEAIPRRSLGDAIQRKLNPELPF